MIIYGTEEYWLRERDKNHILMYAITEYIQDHKEITVNEMVGLTSAYTSAHDSYVEAINKLKEID